jgi:tetratricopeptide (TPR) repeat protein
MRLRKAPASAERSRILASLLLDGNHPDAALKNIEEGLTLDPKSGALRLLAGDGYLMKKDYAKAAESYQDALAKGADEAEANVGLCRAYVERMKTDEGKSRDYADKAEKAANDAIAAGTNRFEPHAELAYLRLVKGAGGKSATEAARAELGKAEAITRMDPLVLTVEVLCALEEGNEKQAGGGIQRFLGQRPKAEDFTELLDRLNLLPADSLWRLGKLCAKDYPGQANEVVARLAALGDPRSEKLKKLLER